MSCDKHGYTNGTFCPACDLEELGRIEQKTTTPRLVPDRPSERAIAALREVIAHYADHGPVGHVAGKFIRQHGHALLSAIDAAAPPTEAPAERGDAKLVAMLRSHRNYLVQHAALFPEGSCMAAELDEMIQLAAAPAGEWKPALLKAVDRIEGEAQFEDWTQGRILVEVRKAIAAAPAGEVALNAEYTRGRNDGWEAAKAAPAAPATDTAAIAMLKRIRDWGFSGRTWSAMRAPTMEDVEACILAYVTAPRVTGGLEAIAELIAADLEYDRRYTAQLSAQAEGQAWRELAEFLAARDRRAKALQAATGGAENG